MVWGCLTSKGVGKLVKVSNKMNSTEYISVLEDGLVETLDTKKIRPSDIVFQQDNAPCHVSKDSRSWFSTNNIAL